MLSFAVYRGMGAYVCVLECAHINMYVCGSVRVCVCVCASASMCLSVYACVSVCVDR